MVLFEGYNQGNYLVNIFNEKRRALCPFEEAKELQALHNGGLTQNDIARMFGMSQKTVSNKLNLNKLGFMAKRCILNGQMPVTAGYMLGSLPESIQIDVIKEALSDKWRASSNDIKRIINRS